MKKLQKKILTIMLSLVLALIPITCVPVSADEVQGASTAVSVQRTDDTSIYDIDLSSQFNSDRIVTVGEYLDAEGDFFMTNSAIPKITDNYATFKSYPYDAVKATANSAVSDIKMYFKPEGLKSGVNDNIEIAQDVSYTIPVVEAHTSHIRFIVEGTATTKYQIKFNYTDNTTSGVTIKHLSAGSYGNATNRKNDAKSFADLGYGFVGYNPAKISPIVYTKVETEGDENYGKYKVSNGNTNNVGVVTLQALADYTKTLKSVTFTPIEATAGTAVTGRIYSLSQDTLSNDEISAYLTSVQNDETLMNTTDVFTFEQAESLRLAKEYLSILEDTTAYETLNNAILEFGKSDLIYTNRADNTAVYDIDLTNKVNADTIGAEGNGISSSWYGFDGTNGFPIDYITDGGLVTFKGRGYNSETAAYFDDTSKNFNFQFSADGRMGGVNDAVKIMQGSPVEIPLLNKNTNNIKIAVGNYSAKATGFFYMDVKVTYTDGTVDDSYPQVSLTEGASSHEYNNRGYDSTASLRAINRKFSNFTSVKPSADGTVLETGSAYTNQRLGFRGYIIDTDPTKTVKSVTVSSGSAAPVMLYAVAQTELTTAEIQEYLATVLQDTELMSATDTFTTAQVEALETANKYIAILESRGEDVTAYASIVNALANIKKATALIYQTREDNTAIHDIDLTNKFNVDTIGAAGDKIDDSWTGFIENTSGKVGYRASWWGTSGSKAFAAVGDNGEAFTFEFSTDGLKGGVKDAVSIESGSSLNFKLLPKNTSNIKFAISNVNNYAVDVRVNYTDGTFSDYDKLSMYEATSSAEYKKGGLGDTTTFGVINRFLATGETVAPSTEDPTTLAVSTFTNVDGDGGRYGFRGYIVVTDSAKTVDSITISASGSEKPIRVYALAQTEITVDEATTYLNTLLTDTTLPTVVTYTEEQAAQLKTAETYLAILEANEVADIETTYKTIYTMVKKMNAEQQIYIDLSAELDTDLIVPNGETIPENYTLPTGFNALFMSPTTAFVTAENSLNKYKLADGYKSVNGADAIAVMTDTEEYQSVTINLDTENQPLIKSLGFVITGDTESIANNGNTFGSKNVPVKVHYNDGTFEQITIKAYDADCPYGDAIVASGANKISASFGRINTTTSEGATSATFTSWTKSGLNGMAMYENVAELSLTANFTEDSKDRAISKIEFEKANVNYYVLAVTAIPYTNTELITSFEDNVAYGDVYNGDTEALDASLVTKENAVTVLEGSLAAFELNERGWTEAYFTDECDTPLADVTAVYNAAVAALTPAVVSITVDSIENGTATVSLKNTFTDETYNKPYVLVIAAYTDSNKTKLLDVNMKSGTLTIDTNATDTISVTPTENAYYEVFVWESVSTLKPFENITENITEE